MDSQKNTQDKIRDIEQKDKMTSDEIISQLLDFDFEFSIGYENKQFTIYLYGPSQVGIGRTVWPNIPVGKGYTLLEAYTDLSDPTHKHYQLMSIWKNNE